MKKQGQHSTKQDGRALRAEPKTILITEDMPMIRTLYARVLLDAGYRVLEACDAAAAQAFAKTGEVIHLLLTDFHMPGMNGMELAEWFRTCRPQVPVVLVSAGEDNVERSRQHLPWLRCHVKPALPSELIDIVECAIDQGSPPDAA